MLVHGLTRSGTHTTQHNAPKQRKRCVFVVVFCSYYCSCVVFRAHPFTVTIIEHPPYTHTFYPKETTIFKHPHIKHPHIKHHPTPPHTPPHHPIIKALLAAHEAQTLASLLNNPENTPGSNGGGPGEGPRRPPDARPPGWTSSFMYQLGVMLLNKLQLSIGGVHIRFSVRIGGSIVVFLYTTQYDSAVLYTTQYDGAVGVVDTPPPPSLYRMIIVHVAYCCDHWVQQGIHPLPQQPPQQHQGLMWM